MEFAGKSLYSAYWQQLAAKDLEQAIQLDPNNFAAWHNYGDLNYRVGDFWATNDHSNAIRAINAFTHAIAINPQSARSYMGRGWAYLTMNDGAHADADFQMALKLDPSLRDNLLREAVGIRDRKRQEAATRAMAGQMQSSGQPSGNVMDHIAQDRDRAYQDYVQRETARQREQGLVCASCSANGLAPHP
jgi:tetratricopeptide (TPR) repeat protein